MVKHVLKLLVIVVAPALVAAPVPARGTADQAAAPAQSPPRLVVLLVVDQLRTDYLTNYGGTLGAGLKRLMDDGAWFTEGAYPYMNTVTCSGHATIGTGTFPYRHGMILNAWLDRPAGSSPYCTDDGDSNAISYNALPPARGHSAKRMLTRSLGEQLHARGGRSVSLSLKPRSAVPLAGRKADAVVWFDDRGGWSTSSAYAEAPVPFIQQFVAANPLSADVEKVWDRTLDPASYQFEDDAEGEGAVAGWSRTFPHPLGTPGGTDAVFHSRWQRSPFADEYLARMAAASVDALKLGRTSATDFLGVSFSSLDHVGHVFGPRSHEVQDMLVRLDRTIGRLLEHLDKTVGAGNYVLGFSADHGVAEVPEQVKQGGRQPGKIVADALNRVLAPILGEGAHVASTAYTDIYLTRTANEKLRYDPRLVLTVRNALSRLPAVERVFRGDELSSARARSSKDPVVRAAALSYHEGRSGDFIIVPKAHWLLTSSVTTHGTHHPYDQQVPVLVFGAGVRAGRYRTAATPADLAPTLAAVAGVGIERTDGRVLSEALVVTHPQ